MHERISQCEPSLSLVANIELPRRLFRVGVLGGGAVPPTTPTPKKKPTTIELEAPTIAPERFLFWHVPTNDLKELSKIREQTFSQGACEPFHSPVVVSAVV